MLQTTKVANLLEMALELDEDIEDIVLDRIASERDVKNADFLSHKKVWT